MPVGASTWVSNVIAPQAWQTSSGGCCSVEHDVQRWTAIAPDVNHASLNGVSWGSAQSCGQRGHGHTFPKSRALPGA